MSSTRTFLNHSKEWYNQQLHEHVCVVEFEKADQSLRTMICTLKSDQLPAPSATARTVTVPDHQVRVFDVQKQEWRSFNVGTVVSFNVAPEA